MADKSKTLERIGLTRGKAVTLGVLSVVLLVVLYLQFAPANDAAPTAASSASRRLPERVEKAAGDDAPLVVDEPEKSQAIVLNDADRVKWQSPELATVVAYDPFALPAAFPQPQRAGFDGMLDQGADSAIAELSAQELADEVARLQAQLEELMQRGVHVIVKQRDGYVAMIGDRTVHVGDDINGFTVTAIDANGVQVERKTSE